MKFYGKLLLWAFVNLLTSSVYSQYNCPDPTSHNCAISIGGPSDFINSTPENIDFVFDNMKKYVTGINYIGATRLRLKIDQDTLFPIGDKICKWKLVMYIDNTDYAPPDKWEEVIPPYGTSGTRPDLGLIEVKVYNGCNTPVKHGIYQLFDPASTVGSYAIEIISNDAPLNTLCNGDEINGPGSYLTNYNGYNFNIDYRIIPTYALKPGYYQMKIKFCLVEVNY
jgi:hypothetical protein